MAEEMRKPLYFMSAGGLDHTAGEVEQRLYNVLELSTKWGAILLMNATFSSNSAQLRISSEISSSPVR